MYFLFFLSSLSIASALIFIRSKCSASSKRIGLWLDNWTIFTIGMVIVPAFVALGFMVGKYNLPWWELRGQEVVRMNRGGCCTQAMVFPREKVEGLMSFLTGEGRGQTDLMIEDYAEKGGLERLALGRQAVQHVGAKSKFFSFGDLDGHI